MASTSHVSLAVSYVTHLQTDGESFDADYGAGQPIRPQKCYWRSVQIASGPERWRSGRLSGRRRPPFYGALFTASERDAETKNAPL